MSRPNKQRRAARPDRPANQAGRRPEPTTRRFGGALWVVSIVVLVVGTLLVLAMTEEDPASVERDPVLVAAGEALYVESCATCHGVDLTGTATGPPFLVPTYAPNHHGDEAFQRAVVAGVQPHHWNFGPMVPVEGLSRDDVSKIVAYVRSVQEAEGILRDPTHP
jgi:mono/diheme cytochrome c family protein